ncbi:probable mannitol dehydrogenase [Medicago truncatula]|uniref:probable mannitol dehydrogenase n=1 Tax=Medicago truncatula TaxID=3880 RepID=UPI000D2F42ED|nr:probable mannitol dehydrogenase [Medicago truncatula]
MATQPEFEHPKKAFGWAARDPSGVLSTFNFSRRETGEKDVAFKVLYCGICHTDLHMAKNGWGTSTYPLVPGHEIVGVVTLDGIIDTISADHSLLPLIDLLKSHGKLVLVGAPEKPLELPAWPLLVGRKMVAGSGMGGMKETQEMIDFAAKHNVQPDIEVIPMDYVNTAMERVHKSDVKYRFVIDIRNTLKTSP